MSVWHKIGHDRLPRPDQDVLVFLKGRDPWEDGMEVCTYLDSDYEIFRWDWDKDKYPWHRVTHWMELPEAPGDE